MIFIEFGFEVKKLYNAQTVPHASADRNVYDVPKLGRNVIFFSIFVFVISRDIIIIRSNFLTRGLIRNNLKYFFLFI